MRNTCFLVFILLSISLSAQQEIRNTVLVQLESEAYSKSIFKDRNGLINIKCLSKSLNIYKIDFDYFLTNENLQAIFLEKGVVVSQFEHTFEMRDSIPNDSLFGEQWSMLNDGVNGTVEDADIDAELAWSKTVGGVNLNGDTLIIAVIDGGFGLDHPDINWWKNSGEIPNNNIDDDNNGFIDDYDGWNAYNSNGDLSSEANHGTHVSGIAGATGNNTEGITGVNWQVKILPIRGSTTQESTAIEAYGYLYELRKQYNESDGEEGHLIVATNSSFGVNSGNPDNYPLWCAFYDSLGSVGILNAVAGPNADWNIDEVGDIPGTCPSDYTLSVTNTNSADEKGNSGYGILNVDLGAPGTDIKSTIPENFGGQWYNTSTGTSMASPHVAGAVALVLSGACDSLWTLYQENPSEVAADIKRFLLDGVDVIPSMEGATVSGGRLNLNGALDQMQNHCDVVLGIENNISVSEYFWNISPNPVKDRLVIRLKLEDNVKDHWEIRNELGQVIQSSEERIWYAGQNEFSIPTDQLTQGIYFIHWGQGSTKRFIKL